MGHEYDDFWQKLDDMTLPVAEFRATLTRADQLEAGDRVVAGKGSRYKGPDFTVDRVESFRASTLAGVLTLVNIFGTRKGGGTATMRGVPADACYWVEEGSA